MCMHVCIQYTHTCTLLYVNTIQILPCGSLAVVILRKERKERTKESKRDKGEMREGKRDQRDSDNRSIVRLSLIDNVSVLEATRKLDILYTEFFLLFFFLFFFPSSFRSDRLLFPTANLPTSKLLKHSPTRICFCSRVHHMKRKKKKNCYSVTFLCSAPPPPPRPSLLFFLFGPTTVQPQPCLMLIPTHPHPTHNTYTHIHTYSTLPVTFSRMHGYSRHPISACKRF